MMILGKGAIISGSCKHILNGRSSTEKEIISVDDSMAQILHTMYFMWAQGYDLSQNILFRTIKARCVYS